MINIAISDEPSVLYDIGINNTPSTLYVCLEWQTAVIRISDAPSTLYVCLVWRTFTLVTNLVHFMFV